MLKLTKNNAYNVDTYILFLNIMLFLTLLLTFCFMFFKCWNWKNFQNIWRRIQVGMFEYLLESSIQIKKIHGNGNWYDNCWCCYRFSPSLQAFLVSCLFWYSTNPKSPNFEHLNFGLSKLWTPRTFPKNAGQTQTSESELRTFMQFEKIRILIYFK